MFAFILKISFLFRVSGTGEQEDSDEQLLQCLIEYENATASEGTKTCSLFTFPSPSCYWQIKFYDIHDVIVLYDRYLFELRETSWRQSLRQLPAHDNLQEMSQTTTTILLSSQYNGGRLWGTNNNNNNNNNNIDVIYTTNG